jgi:hypothetical protein
MRLLLMVPADGPLGNHIAAKMMLDRLGQATAVNKPTLPCVAAMIQYLRLVI